MNEIRDLGLQYVRKGFIWSDIERKPGVYDFTRYDAFVERCAKRNLRIIGAIAFGNDKLYGPVTEPSGQAAYARFAAALAQRYARHAIVWEIWNEPNTRTFWGRHGQHNSRRYAREYTALVKAAAAEMKRADPSSTVAAGSVSCLWEPSFNWQRACFETGMNDAQVDAWSLHPYGFQQPEAYLPEYQKVRQILEGAGSARLPLLNTECGYKKQLRQGCPASDPECTERLQAAHLVRQYLVDKLAGMGVSIWYEWSGREGFAIKGDNAHRMTASLATLLRELRGYSLVSRLASERRDDFVLHFNHPIKGDKFVAWTAGESHRIALPQRLGKSHRRTDMMGECTPRPRPERAGSLTLLIAPTPVYISTADDKGHNECL